MAYSTIGLPSPDRAGYVNMRPGSSFGSFRPVSSGGEQSSANRFLSGYAGLGSQMASMGRGLFGQAGQYAGINAALISDAMRDPLWLVDQAATDVVNSFGQARGALERNMSRMGINAASGRYQGLQKDMALAQAAAEAGARTRASRQASDIGFNRRMQVAGIGTGLQQMGLNAMQAGGANMWNAANAYGDMAADRAAATTYQDRFDKWGGDMSEPQATPKTATWQSSPQQPEPKPVGLPSGPTPGTWAGKPTTRNPDPIWYS